MCTLTLCIVEQLYYVVFVYRLKNVVCLYMWTTLLLVPRQMVLWRVNAVVMLFVKLRCHVVSILLHVPKLTLSYNLLCSFCRKDDSIADCTQDSRFLELKCDHAYFYQVCFKHSLIKTSNAWFIFIGAMPTVLCKAELLWLCLVDKAGSTHRMDLPRWGLLAGEFGFNEAVLHNSHLSWATREVLLTSTFQSHSDKSTGSKRDINSWHYSSVLLFPWTWRRPDGGLW